MCMELAPRVCQFLSWKKQKKKQGMPGSTLGNLSHLGKSLLGQTLDTPNGPRAPQGSDWVTNPYTNPCGTCWEKGENPGQALL